MQGWQDELFVQILENIGNAGRKIVVEQNGTGIESIKPQAILRADKWFEQQTLPIGKLN